MAERVEAGSYTVQSVARAIAALDAIGAAGSDGLNLTEVAEVSGVSKSGAFAMLQTLLGAGYLRDVGSGQTRRYCLGQELTRLGDLARSRLSLQRVAAPVLREVADKLSLTVRLGRLQDGRVVIIDRADTAVGVRIDLHTDDRELLHCTAIGKALLSRLDDARVSAVIGVDALAPRTERTITSVDSLLADLAATRARGYALDDEEDYPGVICVGAGIDLGSGSPAAISVAAIKAALSPGEIRRVGGVLAASATQISHALGMGDQ
jgi:IclR family acetate operon transcriptional repressor